MVGKAGKYPKFVSTMFCYPEGSAGSTGTAGRQLELSLTYQREVGPGGERVQIPGENGGSQVGQGSSPGTYSPLMFCYCQRCGHFEDSPLCQEVTKYMWLACLSQAE